MPSPDTQLICVENTEARLLGFPADKGAKIKAFNLAPMRNFLPAATVEALQARRTTKRGLQAGWDKAVERGAIKVHTPADSDALRRIKDVTAPSSLKDMNTKAACAIVRVTSDEAVLGLWLNAETRARVKDAIQLRLAELSSAGAPQG